MSFLNAYKHIVFTFFVCATSFCLAQEKERPEHEKEAQQFVFSGNEELLEGNVLDGEKSFRKAIAKDPNNLEAKYNLGYSYYKTSNFQEAAMRNKQAVKNATTKAEKHAAYHNLGNSYLQMQKPDEAIEAYKNALRNNPTDDETRYNLAVARKMKEQQDQNKDQNQDQQNKDNKDNKEEDGEDKENNNKEDDNKEDDKKDEGDKDKEKEEEKDGDKDDEEKDKEKEEEKDGDKDDEEKDGEGDEEKDEDKKPPQPREGKLSPEQVKSLLEAMADEEKKVQDKMNDKKQGVRVNTDKDW